MSDDLVILLEWLNANGISEFFNESPVVVCDETQNSIIEVSEKKNFDQVIEQFAEKTIKNKTTTLNQLDFIDEAKTICDNINSIDTFFKNLDCFEGFLKMKKLSTNTIFYEGNINSRILFINDIPNEIDDLEGKVFSGQAGELMQNMLKAVDLNYKECCFINTFFWRLAGNRIPIKEEINLCKPFVERFISIIKPELIVFTGNYGIGTFTNLDSTILRSRGKFFDYSNSYLYENIKAIVMFNPNFLLKNPSRKKEAWNDLLVIKSFLSSAN